MKTRIPGNSGLEISEIGLGCMGMSFGRWDLNLIP
jgi:aryl-alcohol dehydrogenase-like predicted oxidoreductase